MSSNLPPGVSPMDPYWDGPPESKQYGIETCEDCNKDTMHWIEEERYIETITCGVCGLAVERDYEPPTREDEAMERRLGW